MGLEPNFSLKSITQKLEKEIANINNAVLNELKYVALEFVKTARSKTDMQGSFEDQTGNLRSSIGYLIFKNGQPVDENFDVTAQGQEGKRLGYEYGVNRSQSELGYVLIVVAGMNYAVYVESKGFDVITGSSFKAESDLKAAFDKLQRNLR